MAWSLQVISKDGARTFNDLKSGGVAKRLAKELKPYNGNATYRVFDPAGQVYQWAEVTQGGSWRMRWQWASSRLATAGDGR